MARIDPPEVSGNDVGGAGRARRQLAPLVIVGAVSTATMAALLVMAAISGLTIEHAVIDPQELTRHRFLGVVSNAGALLWGATVAICLFAAFTLDRPGAPGLKPFFLASAGVAFVLLIDDFLLVHEFADDIAIVFVDFERTRSQKDILEATVFAGYAMLFAAYVYRFRDLLRPSPQLRYLVLAIALFGVSAAIDFAPDAVVERLLPGSPRWEDVEILAEEGSKFLGIGYFAGFYVGFARDALRRQGSG